MRISRRLVSCFVGVLVCTAGCNKQQAETAKTDAPVPVTLATATIQPVQRAVEVVGTIFGDEDVTISAKVPGRIASIALDMAAITSRLASKMCHGLSRSTK